MNIKKKSNRIPFPTWLLRELQASLLIIFFLFFSVQASAKDNSYDPGDPGKYVANITQELLQEAKSNPDLYTGPAEVTEQYFSEKVKKYVNVHMLLNDLLIGSKKNVSLRALSESEQEALVNDFTRYLVRKHISTLKKVFASSKMEVISGKADVSVAYVEILIEEPPQIPIIAGVRLVRGWDDWKINDIIIGDNWLSKSLSAHFKNEIKIEGVYGIINKLKAQNSMPTESAKR